MCVRKQCADYLRVHVLFPTGERIKASHAHEIVAAFFGYGTAAALQAETKYPLTALQDAKFLIPDLSFMDVRITKLRELSPYLPNADLFAFEIGQALVAGQHFNGEIWRSRERDDDVNGYIQRNAYLFMDALSGEMAETNAYFDEIYIHEYEYQHADDALIVTLQGEMNGETDQDRAFSGDKIVFSTTMNFGRVAGRTAFAEPELDTGGSVDDSAYYDSE